MPKKNVESLGMLSPLTLDDYYRDRFLPQISDSDEESVSQQSPPITIRLARKNADGHFPKKSYQEQPATPRDLHNPPPRPKRPRR